MILEAFPTDPATIGLIFLLILVFTAGLKIIQALIDTITVSVFSAAFYLAIALILDYTLTFRRVLTFAVIGSSLYVGLTAASTVYGTATTAAGIPTRLFGILASPFKALYRYIRKKKRLRELRKEDSYHR